MPVQRLPLAGRPYWNIARRPLGIMEHGDRVIAAPVSCNRLGRPEAGLNCIRAFTIMAGEFVPARRIPWCRQMSILYLLLAYPLGGLRCYLDNDSIQAHGQVRALWCLYAVPVDNLLCQRVANTDVYRRCKQLYLCPKLGIQQIHLQVQT